MKIALIGYGKMGKAIEKIALSRGHEITARVTSSQKLEAQDFSTTDVAIEFTAPQVVINNLEYLLEKNIPVIVGTTGWNNHLQRITELVEKKNGSLLYASNFSIGVNLFFELNKLLAKLMNQHGEYHVSMKEIHHTEKLDAPSGTAITLAEGIIENHDAVEDWSCPQHPTKNEFEGGVEITAIREPNVPGTHTIEYHSPIDFIRITHEAKSREGFALGAVIAAEFIQGKQGVFTMNDVLKLSK